MNIIEIENLSKYFKINKHFRGKLSFLKNLFTRQYTEIRAVDGITFSMKPGELVGYLGPNGAGKSTTIKMLAGLLVPTNGHIKVDGFVPWKDRIKYVKNIGAVFGQRTTLWWDLPVIESFSLIKYIYEIPQSRFNHNLDEFRELLDLDSFLDTPVRSLSLGQRMRADLCAALLHNPKILFLDEPTIGLDVVAKERIRKFILHINQTYDVTVILTTHDLTDVEKLCNRILIIDQGQLLFDGDLDLLNNQFGGKRRLVVDFFEPYQEIDIELYIDDNGDLRKTFYFNRDAMTASELIGIIASKNRIRDLQVYEPEIEDTIRRIYEERLLSK